MTSDTSKSSSESSLSRLTSKLVPSVEGVSHCGVRLVWLSCISEALVTTRRLFCSSIAAAYSTANLPPAPKAVCAIFSLQSYPCPRCLRSPRCCIECAELGVPPLLSACLHCALLYTGKNLPDARKMRPVAIIAGSRRQRGMMQWICLTQLLTASIDLFSMHFFFRFFSFGKPKKSVH